MKPVLANTYPRRIISGGQTGADRGALQACLDWDFDYGGFVTRGRRAEDGRVPDKFDKLTELKSANYPPRTRANVRAADATLLVLAGPHESLRESNGSLLTLQACREENKPRLVLSMADSISEWDFWGVIAAKWCRRLDVKTLNVAGSRESRSPKGASLENWTRILVGILIESARNEAAHREFEALEWFLSKDGLDTLEGD